MQHSKTEMLVPAGVLSRGGSINPSEPPSPEFSRTPSQSTVATTVDGREIAKRLELVRSQSDMSYSHFSDVDLVGKGRERKESSASSIGSTSGAKDNVRRMNAFWDATPEEIAMSLTRMEWEYFVSLGPRDIPRHMWTPEDKRDKDSPMERIVYYFNHIAKWVSYTLLFSPKFKDRVRDMEKMLRVVIELRKLDNYDTCFAVISGLENQAVYRLHKTLEEVKKVDLETDDRKRSQGNLRVGKGGSLWLKYQSCRALMARDRNFAPYRMAFKNSFGSRIPWLYSSQIQFL
jgi:RasGEF domain